MTALTDAQIEAIARQHGTTPTRVRAAIARQEERALDKRLEASVAQASDTEPGCHCGLPHVFVVPGDPPPPTHDGPVHPTFVIPGDRIAPVEEHGSTEAC